MNPKHAWIKPLAILLVGAAIGVAVWYWQQSKRADEQHSYKTEAVDRGDIVQIVSANGTLNPVVLVNVGTQISGTIQKLSADYNDRVKAGQILAELDPALVNAQLKQDEANLEAAQASLRLAQLNETRTRELVTKKFLAPQQLDQAVQTTEAARAQVKLSQAQLQRSRANLGYSVIRSPVSGVVVARNVDLGQTVAASFQTPTLFQIAQDLRSMQIDTTVAEADIGNVKIGQEVSFTVDAFPNRTFKGSVKQVRLNPTIQQNVVSYNVVVATDNADEKLMPGMTAHVSITANQVKSVLRVPNAALRFKLDQDGSKEHKNGNGSRVFKLVEDKPQAVMVKTGISDGSYTEIISGSLNEGDAVITRSQAKTKEPDASPFRMRMM